MQHSQDPTTQEIEKSLLAGSRASFSGGLYIIKPKGTNDGKRGYWRFDYRFEKKSQTISVGLYPDVTIEEAKQRAADYKLRLELGINPSTERKSRSAAKDAGVAYSSTYALTKHPHLVESVAKEWLDIFTKNVSKKTRKNTTGRINNHILPIIGHKLMSEVTHTDIHQIIGKLADVQKHYTLHRVAKLCADIFEFGIDAKYTTHNPCRSALKKLPSLNEQHFPAVTSPAKLAPVLAKMYSYNGTFPVACALKLLPMTFVRPGNLRTAEWNEFDLTNGFWRIPAQKMKSDQRTKREGLHHYVPLSSQAIKVLLDLYEVTGDTGVLFPSQRGKGRYISDGTINKALRSLGLCTQKQITGHGFRAVARTMIEEELGKDEKFIELQLDHLVKDPNGCAYNRTKFLKERREMMQEWSNYLQDLRLHKIQYDDLEEYFIPHTERVKIAQSNSVETATSGTQDDQIQSHKPILQHKLNGKKVVIESIVLPPLHQSLLPSLNFKTDKTPESWATAVARTVPQVIFPNWLGNWRTYAPAESVTPDTSPAF